MKTSQLFQTLIAAGLLSAAPLSVHAADQPADAWIWEGTIYGLAASMTGDVTFKGIPSHLDVSFSDIAKNLQFGAMGTLRATRGSWSYAVDGLYMGLGATTKNGVKVDVDQWCVEPSVWYRVDPKFQLLFGARYNSISGELRGAGILPSPVVKAGTVDWWDPIVGAQFSEDLGGNWGFDMRVDVGGSSGLTWQIFPVFNWHFSPTGLMQIGYRWVSNDYSTGSGATLFEYKVISQGPQLGVTFRF